jgi:methionine-rich copper-binding protein CopC
VPVHRLLAAPAAALAALALAAAPAAAHTSVERVEPAEGATVRAVPAQVRVTYGAPLASATSAAALVGSRDVAGAPRLDRADARRLVIPLRDGGPGAYRVSWEVVGADGHALTGSTTFRARPSGAVLAAHRVGARAASAARALARAAGAPR